MSYSLRPVTPDQLDNLVDFAKTIYANTDPNKYPEFRISGDIDDTVRLSKFFNAFILPSKFNDYNIRQAYAVYDSNGVIQAAVGVRRWNNLPSWSVSWMLSPSIGVRFIPLFRQCMVELCKIHEAAGMNEFYVTYPTSREAAYSKIMLPFRERYYSFVECTLPARQMSPYALIHSLMGSALHPHEMNLRRYILRRENTSAPSEGGTAIKRINNK